MAEANLFKEQVSFVPLPKIFENFEVCLGDEIDAIRKEGDWQARDVVGVFWQSQFDEAEVWDGVGIAKSLFGGDDPYREWEKINEPTTVGWDRHNKQYLQRVPIGVLLTLGDRSPEQMENGCNDGNKNLPANRKPLDDCIDEYRGSLESRTD